MITAIKMKIKEISKDFIFEEYFFYSAHDFSTVLTCKLSSVAWVI